MSPYGTERMRLVAGMCCPDDPDYGVCKITPCRIEDQGMGMTPPEVWEA